MARSPGRILRHRLRAFSRDTSGTIIPFALVFFLMLVLITGMAVDYIRHETFRAELQNALDRGLLAAADLDQQVDPADTVKEYFKSAAWFGGTVEPTVTIETDTTSKRTLNGAASYTFNTYFLKLIGFPTLTVNVAGKAEDRQQNVEVSLVLDISGTMRYCDNGSQSCAEEERRIAKLIPAAQGFVSKILTGNQANYTTINLVPYAGQVNPGVSLFNSLGGSRTYGWNDSSCLDFTAADFDASGLLDLPGSGSYDQVPNFHNWTISNYWMEWGWCPSNDVAITLMSNDETGLNQAIENLRYNLHDGTGTYNAMKWGASLLNPSANPVLAPLLPPQFDTRPAPFEDEETLKFIVLMTDGIITRQDRPIDPTATINNTVELKNQSGTVSTTTVSTSAGRTYFQNLCDAAKTAGIVVFTIAYSNNNQTIIDQMKACAYNPNTHFYNVNGLDINYAFAEIATTINKVKLIP